MDSKHAIGTEALTVTPSDSTTYFPGIIPYIGVTGDIAVVGVDSPTAVTFKSFPAGQFLPLRCKQVMNTNTTATNIVAAR